MTEELDQASKGRTSALSEVALHTTAERLYIESVNLELDKLEGELKKLFPGDAKRVASFLAPTRPRRKRGRTATAARSRAVRERIRKGEHGG